MSCGYGADNGAYPGGYASGWRPPAPCGWVPPLPCSAPCQPVCFQAIAPTAIALPPNILTALSFTQATTPSPYYTPITGLFKAPYTGTFSFSANVAWATAVADTTFIVYIQRNGVTTALTSSQTQPLAGTYVSPVTGALSLNGGDTVGVIVSANQAAMVLGYAAVPNAITSFSGGAVGTSC